MSDYVPDQDFDDQDIEYIRGDIHEKTKTELISIIDEMHLEIVALQKVGIGFIKTIEKCKMFFERLQWAKSFSLEDSNKLMKECGLYLESEQADE